MKLWKLGAFLGVLLLSVGAEARVNVDVHIGIPAPPVVAFPAPPQEVIVPDTQVYYVPEATDYDMYRVGPYYYVNRDGYWYRAHHYGGPFAVVQYSRVPHDLLVLPDGFHHHPPRPFGGPPGHNKHWHGHGHHHHDDD